MVLTNRTISSGFTGNQLRVCLSNDP